LQKQA
jgi:hypothetical protein